jgi:hypothetical protein
MHRRLVLSAILTLVLAGATQAALVGYWKMDDGSGTIAKDSTANGRNGTLMGTATWGVGEFGGAIRFDGTDSCYLDLPIGPLIQDLTDCTFTVWTNWTGQSGAWSRVWDFGNGSANGYMFVCANQGSATGNLRFAITQTSNGNEQVTNSPATLPTGWHNVAVTIDHAATTATLWVDGEVVGTNTGTTLAPSDLGNTTGNYLAKSQWPDPYWSGLMDDFRIYDEVLTQADIQKLMTGYSPLSGMATSPSPPDKATDVVREAVLSWVPGATNDITHNVYLGTNFDDVNTALTDSAVCVSKEQDANSYDPPVRLDFGVTYYWRIDEVNMVNATVIKGEVWSFTVEPYAYQVAEITATASSEGPANPAVNTINGSGMTGDFAGTDPKTMWLSTALPASIQYDLDRVYKLDQMWVWNHNTQFESVLGFGAKDVTIEYSADGTTWTMLGDFVFDQAPGTDDVAPTSIISLGGIGAKSVRITINDSWLNTKQTGLSEVRFLYIPVMAREPEPATGSTGINPTTVSFSWRAGREAASHDIYIGTDANAVAASTTPTGTSATASYTPSGLELDGTYYWRVDEVNTAETFTTWPSDVWNFTTGSFVVVDNMESYNDTTNKIFDVWIDGYGTTTNGSQVGYDQSANSTFGDTTTVHSGSQSMPFGYGKNGITTSEATRTFGTPQDWTAAGIKTLVLFFYGDPANGPGELYVKINDNKSAYTGDAGNLQRHRWNQWNIDLASVTGGVKAVKTLTIGVTGSGTGTLLIDDIRLYKNAPVIPTPGDPGTANLVGYYAMDNNVQDGSGNGNNGTLVGSPTYAAGLSASNTALKLNGTTDCVDLGNKAVWNPTGSFSVSLWANIGLWSTAWSHVMIGNRGEDNVGWQIRRHSTPSLCFTTRGVGNDDMASVITPPLNEWIHITCVYDDAANTKTIYVNGVQDSIITTTAGAHITATTHDTYIGARANSGNTGPEAYFTGLLDEIRVYNRALTAGEADFLSDPTP